MKALTLTLALGAVPASAQPATGTFTNPVVSGFHPDPSICRVGADYYMVHSTFEYFPGVPVFHSRDLVHWRPIGYCLTRDSQLKLTSVPSSGGIYAPTLRYHKGTFYMITTLVNGRGNFYVTAGDPAGPWSAPVWLDGGGIDPSLLFDDDGKVYYTRHEGMGDGYIAQGTLNLDTGKLEGPLKEIWRGTGGIWPEGPHLYKIKGKYYLMIAEGGTSFDHRVTIARSDNPFGPFTACPGNPILTHRTNATLPIQALGHADLVETPAGWWAVALGIRPQGGFHHLGRETFLIPVTWTKDGWPVMGHEGKIDLVMPAPKLKQVIWPAAPVRNDFNKNELGLEWNYLRNPNTADYSLSARPGWLRLTPSSLSMNSTTGSPTFVGRRQEHLQCRISTKLSFDPQQEGEEAGLVLRGNERNHFELAVTLIKGKRVLIYRWIRNRKTEKESVYDLPGKEEVVLTVTAFPREYVFSYQLPDGSSRLVNYKEGPAGIARTQDLSSEKIGGFTGVYIGLYATGNGKPGVSPADFDWFDYEGIAK